MSEGKFFLQTGNGVTSELIIIFSFRKIKKKSRERKNFDTPNDENKKKLIVSKDSPPLYRSHD